MNQTARIIPKDLSTRQQWSEDPVNPIKGPPTGSTLPMSRWLIKSSEIRSLRTARNSRVFPTPWKRSSQGLSENTNTRDSTAIRLFLFATVMLWVRSPIRMTGPGIRDMQNMTTTDSAARVLQGSLWDSLIHGETSLELIFQENTIHGTDRSILSHSSSRIISSHPEMWSSGTTKAEGAYISASMQV